MMGRETHSKDGMTLAVVLLFITVLTTLFGSVIALVLNEYRLTKATALRAQALYAAEAGIDLALGELNRGNGEPSGKNWVREGDSFRLRSTPAILREGSTLSPSVQVTVALKSMAIESVGHAQYPGLPASTRKVLVTLRRSPNGYSVDFWREVASGTEGSEDR